MDTQPTVYTRDQVAEILQVSMGTLSQLLGSERLYHFRVGKQIRIPAEALTAYIQGQEYNAGEGLTRQDASTWPPTPSLFEGGSDE